MDELHKKKQHLEAYLHELGFLYVSIDLDGYKTGSMNKMLQAL